MNLQFALPGDETIYRLGWTLIHTLWAGAAVAVLLALTMAALRHRSARSRYLAGCAAMVAFLASAVAAFVLTAPPAARPVVQAAVPAIPAAATVGDQTLLNLEAVPQSPLTPVSVAPVPVHVEPSAVPPAIAQQEPSVLARATQALEPALPWLVLAWTVGVCILALWQLAGWVAAQRLTRLGIRPTDAGLVALAERLAQKLGVTRAVRLLESALVCVPTVVGWLRPVILLPLGFATGLTPAQVESIIVHELSHIRRYDYLVNLLQSLVEALLFYHPATWYISRRIRLERENCCDDLVLAFGANEYTYAESLLHLARQSKTRGLAVVVGVAATGKPSELRSRIGRVLGAQVKTSRLTRSWPVVIVLGAIIVAASSLMTLNAESTDPSSSTTKPATRASDKRQYEDVQFFINNHRYGPTNGAYGPMSPASRCSCGHPGAVSQVSWKFLRSGPEGDVYSFSREFPLDADNATVTTKEVTYSDIPMVIFADEVQKVIVRPLRFSLYAGTRGPDQMSFSPVVEKSLSRSSADESGLVFINLKSGAILRPPFLVKVDATTSPGIETSLELKKWVEQTGVDAFIIFLDGYWAMGGLEMRQQDDSAGRVTSAGVTVRDVLADFEMKNTTVHVSSYCPFYMSGMGYGPDSYSYFRFRTREGVMGVLQWSGINANAHSIKLAYKFVQATDNVQPAAQPLASLRYLAIQPDSSRERPSVYWRPDGQIVNDAKELKSVRGLPHTGMGGYGDEWAFYHLWFSLPNVDDRSSVRVEILDADGEPMHGADGSLAIGVERAESPAQPGWIIVCQSPGKKGQVPPVASVLLEYATGKWTTLGTIKGDMAGGAKWGLLTVTGIRTDAQGLAFVEYSFAIGETEGNQYRAEAVMKDGRIVDCQGRYSWEKDDVVTGKFMFQVPLQDVDHFTFYSRPTRTALFNNVSLQPGESTSPQVKEVGVQSATQPVTQPSAIDPATVRPKVEQR